MASFMAFTVSADESIANISRYDALDYITLVDGSNIINFSGSKHIVQELPVDTYIYGIDLVAYYTGAPMQVKLKTLHGDVTLTPISVGNNLCRFIAQNITIDNGVLDLTFTNGGTYSYVNVVACYLETDKVEQFPDVCSFNVMDSALGSYSGSMSSPNTFASVTWMSDEMTSKSPYRVFVYLDNWQKYDYVDLHLYAEVDAIEALSVYFDQSVVPFEVSYLDNVYADEVGSTTGRHILLRVDLTGLDRTSTLRPVISIDGWSLSVRTCTFGVMFYTGYVKTSLSGFSLYWNMFKDFMTGLFNPGNSGSDDFKDEAADKVDQMQDVNSGMNELQKPDINGINVNLDNIVAPNAVATLTSPMTVLFGNDFFAGVLLMVVTLALVSYVLFGKK